MRSGTFHVSEQALESLLMMLLRFSHVLCKAVCGVRDIRAGAVGDVANFAKNLPISCCFAGCEWRYGLLLIKGLHVAVRCEGRVAFVHCCLL